MAEYVIFCISMTKHVYHNVIHFLQQLTEYVTEYNIIQIASSRIVTEHNAPHEECLRVSQP